MKNKYLLTAIAVVGFSVAAQATTVTWNFLENGSDVTLGNSATFTESGYTLTAYGFNVSGNTPTALYAKNDGVGEQGLGIASDPLDHEINPTAYVQLFTTTTPASSLTSLLLGSVQAGEIANIYVSSTLGSLGSFVGTVTSDTTFDISSYIGEYVGVTASGSSPDGLPNVLLGTVTGTVGVPDGGTTVMLLGGALMGLGLLKRKFLA
jgi:hypothetical protein